MLASSLIFVALSGFVAAGPSRRSPSSVVKETFSPPSTWQPHRSADPDHVLNLRIGLPQSNFGALEQHLLASSDPAHERYGLHLSKAEVEQLVAPTPESVGAVHRWLKDHGFDISTLNKSPAGDWILLPVTVEKAEEMLDTTYHVWKHVDGTELVRTTTYSLPIELHAHIEVIQPTTMFGRLSPQRTNSFIEDVSPAPAQNFAVGAKSANIDASCNATITPACLQQLYNTLDYKPSGENGNKIGIAGYLEQNANFADLKQFYSVYRPEAINFTFDVELVHGGVNSQNISEAGEEAALDVQYVGALTFPMKNIYYVTGGRPPFTPSNSTPTNTNEPYQDWLEHILAQYNIPSVFSTSYGDDELTVPPAYAKRVCEGFAQLGARGASLLFSSGDGGVGDGNPDPATAVCLTNDGKNKTQFLPLFPASCPYVTAVGGTHFINPEVAVAFSGGGFSNLFGRPPWQEGAVADYLTRLGPTYKGLFNPSGRAYPDIAAQGSHFRIFFQGKEASIGGTSASAPVVASVIALLNDVRKQSGKPPLGFLNPWLYRVGKYGLNDITAGNNPGCGTPGFNATQGWDPVTGLGTPDFLKLKKIATGYPY